MAFLRHQVKTTDNPSTGISEKFFVKSYKTTMAATIQNNNMVILRLKTMLVKCEALKNNHQSQSLINNSRNNIFSIDIWHFKFRSLPYAVCCLKYQNAATNQHKGKQRSDTGKREHYIQV